MWVKYTASYRVSRRVFDRWCNHVVSLARRECIHDSYGMQVGDEVILSQIAGSDTLGSMHSVRAKLYLMLPVTYMCANLGALVKSS